MAEPWTQGSLDALCGIYALVNSLRLLYRGLDDAAAEAVFARLIICLEQADRLAQALCYGIRERELQQLLPRLKQFLRRHHGVQLRWRCPFDHARFRRTSEFMARLAEGLEKDAPAVAVMALGGSEPHWTVVHRLTQRAIHLCDSGPAPRRVLPLARCSLAETSRRSFIIRPRSTIIVSLQQD